MPDCCLSYVFLAHPLVFESDVAQRNVSFRWPFSMTSWWRFLPPIQWWRTATQRIHGSQWDASQKLGLNDSRCFSCAHFLLVPECSIWNSGRLLLAPFLRNQKIGDQALHNAIMQFLALMLRSYTKHVSKLVQTFICNPSCRGYICFISQHMGIWITWLYP